MAKNVRVRRKRAAPSSGIPNKIKQQIEHLVEAQEQVTNLQLIMKGTLAEVVGFMEKHRLAHIEGTHGTQMDAVVKKGRNTSSVDPEQLRGICVSDEDFYECVKVIQTKAKQIVPGNALDKIKTVIPGTDTTVFTASRKD